MYYTIVQVAHNFISMQMAEQLLDIGEINERTLCHMNMEQVRRDIGCSLLSYSGNFCDNICSYNLVYSQFYNYGSHNLVLISYS